MKAMRALILALVVSSWSVVVYAQQPTADDAHSYLNDKMGRGEVETRDSKILDWSGSGCESTFSLNNGVDYTIEWSQIDSAVVTAYNTSGVRITGTISFENSKKSGSLADVTFSMPDAAQANSAAKAMSLLRASCASASKF